MTRRYLPAPVTSGPDGAVLSHVGRYAREAVMTAFEMIGGVDRMADWAHRNPGEFFTKLLPKVITRETEIGASQGVEELLKRLDAGEHALDITPRETEDA